MVVAKANSTSRRSRLIRVLGTSIFFGLPLCVFVIAILADRSIIVAVAGAGMAIVGMIIGSDISRRMWRRVRERLQLISEYAEEIGESPQLVADYVDAIEGPLIRKGLLARTLSRILATEIAFLLRD